MEKKSVAVIGAGLAGVSAAQALSEAGWRVVVFEKSRGFGGRCSTKRWEGCVIDHGAPAFTMESREFREAVRRASGDRIRAIESPVGGVDGQLHYHIDGNSRLARDLATGLDVRTGFTVESIRDRVIDGELFDLVVCTAPWPQAAKLAGIDAGPPCTEPCLALLLLHEATWPGLTRGNFALSCPASGDIAWTHCENHKAGRIPQGLTATVVHASESFSRLHLEEAPEDWAALLRPAAEEAWRIPADAFRCMHPHRWRHCRLFRESPGVSMPDRVVFLGEASAGEGIEAAWLRGRSATMTRSAS